MFHSHRAAHSEAPTWPLLMMMHASVEWRVKNIWRCLQHLCLKRLFSAAELLLKWCFPVSVPSALFSAVTLLFFHARSGNAYIITAKPFVVGNYKKICTWNIIHFTHGLGFATFLALLTDPYIKLSHGNSNNTWLFAFPSFCFLQILGVLKRLFKWKQLITWSLLYKLLFSRDCLLKHKSMQRVNAG